MHAFHHLGRMLYNYINKVMFIVYTILFLAEIPHQLSSADPITTENSAYCRGEDSQEKEELCKCRHNRILILRMCVWPSLYTIG